MKKLKYFIPSIIFMIIIFCFSNQTGSESSGSSSQIIIWIQNNLHISIPEIIIRKGAHMSEYALLTLTFIYGFYKNRFPINKIYLYSILSCFLYACSDELHQLFIDGRSGQLTDVFIDTAGGLIMIAIIFLIKKRSLIKK